MKDRIANFTRWILYGLLFISALAGVLFYTGALGYEKGLGASNIIYIGNIFFYLALVVLIAAPVYTMINNPKNVGKMVASVVLLIVVLAIAYGVAGNTMTPHELAKADISASESRLVGAGLYAVYFTLALAVISIIYSAVIKIFK